MNGPLVAAAALTIRSEGLGETMAGSKQGPRRRPQALPSRRLEGSILEIRGQRVILDSDLARVYGVETRVLNQAVRRNRERFPADFAFRLAWEEGAEVLRSRSQPVILKRGENVKYLPYAFTEHGALMAASVLNSPRAVQMSIFVVRAFHKLRKLVAGQAELASKLIELERRVGAHDHDLRAIIEAIRQLVQPPEKPRRPIGFSASSGLVTGPRPRSLT